MKIFGTTLDRNDLTRLGGALFVALVGAVVTGPDGSQTAPLSGVTGSLFHPRVIGWVVAGLLVWAVGTALRIQKTRPTPMTNPLAPVREVFHSTAGRKGVKPSFYVVLIVLAVVIPRGFAPALQLSLFLDIGIYALLGLGLNVVVGFAGLLDLGYIAFYAIGAYATAYFTSNRSLPDHSPLIFNAFFVLPIAAVLAALAGIILGGPTLRLRGDYLAIVTLGFGEIVQILARNSPKYTNGPRGVSFVPHLQVHALGIDYVFTNKALPYYYVLLAIIVLVMIAFSRLQKSRVGRAMAAVREDEVAAEASGVAPVKYKLIAFAIGASVSGFAGVLFATKQFFDPVTFSLQASILVLTIVIFGGMGRVGGPIIGAIVLQGLSYELRDPLPIIGFQVPDADRYIYFGAIIMLMMVFRPQGLLADGGRRKPRANPNASPGSMDALPPGSLLTPDEIDTTLATEGEHS